MLKLIFTIFILIPFFNNWNLVRNYFFILAFFLAGFCYHNFYLFNLGINLGTDFIRYILVLLRVWIIVLVLYASQKIVNVNNSPGGFLITNIVLCLALIFTFSSIDYLLFYIRFERSLIPTLVLILGWGYQPERIQAGIYMLFYTLLASLPLLVSLLRLYKLGGSLSIGLTIKVTRLNYTRFLWYFCTVTAFIVKLPIYLFHLWLPKAHVEAPVAGSMILAGVLLKLGGYGLIRVLPLFRKINNKFSWLWVTIGVLGGVLVRFICLRQIDIKSLIAYSSVAHIGIVLRGLIVLNSWGINGAIVVIVSHGLCSSGLFCIANIVYERIRSRRLMIRKGLLNFIPTIGLWWFLLRIGNIAAPPTLNLLGEINLIIRIVSWNKLTIYSIGLLSFFSAAYTLYIYSLRQHGIFFRTLYSCCSGKVEEFLVIFIHWLPLNVIIIKGSLMVFS